MLRIVEFAPPMSGIEGEFNTFRLGGAWVKRVEVGDKIALMDKKECALIGYAVITGVHKGKLRDMSAQHGFHNHNQRHLPVEGAGERVIAAMQKRYGPNRCTENSIVTVLDMRRLE